MEDPPNLGGEFWQRSTKTPGSSAQQQGGTPAGHGTLPYGISHVSGPGSRQAKSNLKAWACVPQVVTTHPVHCTEYLFLCFGLRGLSLSRVATNSSPTQTGRRVTFQCVGQARCRGGSTTKHVKCQKHPPTHRSLEWEAALGG